MTEHGSRRNGNDEWFPHSRASDAFFARWGRKLSYLLLAGLLPAASLLWKDRETKINLLNGTVADLQLVNVKISALERRVDTQYADANADRQEIKEELRSLRDEVRQMYRRAIEAGGRRP